MKASSAGLLSYTDASRSGVLQRTKRNGVQQDSIDGAENRNISAYPERERENRGQHEAWASHELTASVFHMLEERFHDDAIFQTDTA